MTTKTSLLFAALIVCVLVCPIFAQAATTGAASIQSMIAQSDAAVTQRIDSLNSLIARVNAMQKLSDAQKGVIVASLQSEITRLTTLKTTIDADTTASALRVDMQSITKSYRIYALVVPQTNIAAASDRALTVVGLMDAVQVKLQTRIGQLTNPSASIASAMADITSKLADVTNQANAALTSTASLLPDQGNTKIATANATALKSARDKIKIAMSDLKTARKDFTTITQAIKQAGK